MVIANTACGIQDGTMTETLVHLRAKQPEGLKSCLRPAILVKNYIYYNQVLSPLM